MTHEEKITETLEQLIALVRAVRSEDGEECGSMECDLDVTTASGEAEFWTVTVSRRATLRSDDESLSYLKGRKARRRGAYRALGNPESEQELEDWLRGWDDEDSEIRRDERAARRASAGD